MTSDVSATSETDQCRQECRYVLLDTQVYYVYGFMLLVFLILLIVTVCVAIVASYFLLNAENYHWQVCTVAQIVFGWAPCKCPAK